MDHGQGRSIPWPPRSFDYTPIIFLLWGHKKKGLLYRKDDVNQFHADINDANFNSVARNCYRLQRCIDKNGDVTEGSSFVINKVLYNLSLL